MPLFRLELLALHNCLDCCLYDKKVPFLTKSNMISGSSFRRSQATERPQDSNVKWGTGSFAHLNGQ